MGQRNDPLEPGIPILLTPETTVLNLGRPLRLDWRGCLERLGGEDLRHARERAAVAIEHMEERVRGVPKQMPAIRDLDRLRCALAHAISIGAGPVTRDDLDAMMPAKPRGQSPGVAIGQEIDDAALLEVAQDRAVALAAAPGPIIDPEHARAARLIGATLASTEAEERVGAQGRAETLGQPRAGLSDRSWA